MRDNISERGIMIAEEKRISWMPQKLALGGVGIIELAITTATSLAVTQHYRENYYIILFICILVMLVALFSFIKSCQWGQIKVYDNGFIPFLVPLRYINRRKNILFHGMILYGWSIEKESV